MVSLRFNAYLSETDSDWKAQDQYEVIQSVHYTSTRDGKKKVNGYLFGKYSTRHNCLRITHKSEFKVTRIDCIWNIKNCMLGKVGLQWEAKNSGRMSYLIYKGIHIWKEEINKL